MQCSCEWQSSSSSLVAMAATNIHNLPHRRAYSACHFTLPHPPGSGQTPAAAAGCPPGGPATAMPPCRLDRPAGGPGAAEVVLTRPEAMHALSLGAPRPGPARGAALPASDPPGAGRGKP